MLPDALQGVTTGHRQLMGCTVNIQYMQSSLSSGVAKGTTPGASQGRGRERERGILQVLASLIRHDHLCWA